MTRTQNDPSVRLRRRRRSRAQPLTSSPLCLLGPPRAGRTVCHGHPHANPCAKKRQLTNGQTADRPIGTSARVAGDQAEPSADRDRSAETSIICSGSPAAWCRRARNATPNSPRHARCVFGSSEPPKIRWTVSTEGGLLCPEAWSLNGADLRRRLRGIMDLSDAGRRLLARRRGQLMPRQAKSYMA